MSWWDKLFIAYLILWGFVATPIEKVLKRLLKPPWILGCGVSLLLLSLFGFLRLGDWFAISGSTGLTPRFFLYPALILAISCCFDSIAYYAFHRKDKQDAERQ